MAKPMRWILFVLGIAVGHGSKTGIAAVNLELRPPSQTVRVGNTVNIGLYAVAGGGVNEPVGQIRAVITWNPDFLQLTGVNNDGPYAWLSSGFPDDSAGDNLNGTFLDGQAVYEALAAFAGPATATPAGLLVTTIQFTALDTVTNTAVAIVPQILSTQSAVFNALPPGGVNVTGTLGSNLITLICLASTDCNDINPCTDDSCSSLVCSHVPNDANDPQDGLFCNGTEDRCEAGEIVYLVPPPDCTDGLSCTNDSCDELLDQCVNPILSGRCLIGGACFLNGNVNPVNDCEFCNASQDQTDWSFRVAGSACGSPADTDCDNPDTCNGAGVCFTNQSANGVPCTSDGNDCTADTCSGGVCGHIPLVSGSPCGNGATTACTNPDTCSGFGACQPNHAPDATTCDDGLFCTPSSTCQAGTCVGSGNACPGLVCDEQTNQCKAVNLNWSPLTQSVLVQGTVDIDLIAASGTGANIPFNAVGVIVTWDSTRLELMENVDNGPYAWVLSGFPDDCQLDGLNDPCFGIPFNDGNAYYEAVGQFAPGQPAVATPAGLKITTLRFRGTVPSTTYVRFLPVFGAFTQTQVLDAVVPALNILVGLGPDAEVNILQCTNNAHCLDENFCNGGETCSGGSCVPGVYPCGSQFCDESADVCVDCLVNADCSDGLFCNGAEVCQGNLCFPGSDPCPGPFCSETFDICLECEVDGDCDDGQVCTLDLCSDGFCEYETSDAACSDGVFCNGIELCVEGEGCVSPGNPCPNPVICDEDTDTCGGCEAAITEVVGSRYVRITPPAETQPIALFVIGSGVGVNCVALYVQNDGGLGTAPVFKTPAEWGTVHLNGLHVIPDARYRVHVDCGAPAAPLLSSGSSARTWRYGDVNGDALIDLDDLLLVFEAFGGNFTSVDLEAADMATCDPNGAVDLDDILFMLDAFSGSGFDCAEPCPALSESVLWACVLLIMVSAGIVFRHRSLPN